MNSDWWEPLYDDLLAEMLLVRADDDEVARTVEFLCRALEVPERGRIFDQCCGIGSLSIPLARRGLDVVAVDQSARYVERTQDEARRQSVSIDAHVADAHDFIPAVPCDAAFNWWTSFGYTADDAHNARMFARAFEALRPGGTFALDTLHLPGVLRHFQPHVVTRRHTPSGEIVLWRDSRMALDDGLMLKRWTYFLPDGRRVTHESALRLYLPHRLGEMLRAVGFEAVRFLGSIGGEPLHLDSPRCICLARRPR